MFVHILGEYQSAGAQVALVWGQVVEVDNDSGKVLQLPTKLS